MQNTLDLVSVITPAFNAAAYLAETIESVIAQSYPNWELIVVDDGSTDATREIVTRYAAHDDRIRLIALQQNHGAPAGPRNIGVSNARGTWIAFLDADDIWHPRKLELQIGVLNDTGKVFSCSRMKDFYDLSEIRFEEVNTVGVITIGFKTQQIKGRIPASSVVVKTEVARAFPFREEMKYKAVEDYECWLRILQAHGLCIKLTATLLMYRRVAGQISGSKLLMLKRVYRVHSEYPGTSRLMAAVFSGSHAIGGAYFRLLKRQL